MDFPDSLDYIIIEAAQELLTSGDSYAENIYNMLSANTLIASILLRDLRLPNPTSSRTRVRSNESKN